MSDLMLDVGQANELKLAFRRANYTNDDIKRLCEGNTLADIRNVLLGKAEVNMLEYVIDLNADPFIPEGWSVVQHQRGGSFKWNPKAVKLYLSKPQRKEESIDGNKLGRELENKPAVLNANILDYLLAYPHLIPEEWKKDEKGRTRNIFFWGTLYRGSVGGLFVRCLCWGGGKWCSCGRWVGFDWGVGDPAALRAS